MTCQPMRTRLWDKDFNCLWDSDTSTETAEEYVARTMGVDGCYFTEDDPRPYTVRSTGRISTGADGTLRRFYDGGVYQSPIPSESEPRPDPVERTHAMIGRIVDETRQWGNTASDEGNW